MVGIKRCGSKRTNQIFFQTIIAIDAATQWLEASLFFPH
jgi:hypothetical protein